MEIKQIKDLMGSMVRQGLKRIKIKREGFELELEREDAVQIVHASQPVVEKAAGSRAADIPTSLAPLVPQQPEKKEDDAKYVTSPMVGTFYHASSPEDPPFVKVGDKVDSDTVICIVEAMKVMNEVKAGVSGTVSEVMAENGHPVEFSSKLFRIT